MNFSLISADNISPNSNKDAKRVQSRKDDLASSDDDWSEEENAMSKTMANKQNGIADNENGLGRGFTKNKSNSQIGLKKDVKLDAVENSCFENGPEKKSEAIVGANFFGHVKTKDLGVFKAIPAGGFVGYNPNKQCTSNVKSDHNVPELKISVTTDSANKNQQKREVIINSSFEDSSTDVTEAGESAHRQKRKTKTLKHNASVRSRTSNVNYSSNDEAESVSQNDNTHDTTSSNEENCRKDKKINSDNKENVMETNHLSDRNRPGCPANPLMLKKCPCDICESVRDNTMMFQKFEREIRVPKKAQIVKPHLLFNENLDECPHIIQTRKGAQSNLQRLLEPKMLVHGKFIIHPVKDLCSVFFDPTVHQALQPLKYFEPLKTQAFAWPAIMRGQNVFIVSGPDSGKTMAYIPAICTFVLTSQPDLPNVNGPISLILCPGAKTAEKVYKVFNKLLDPRKEKIIRFAIPPFNILQKVCDLFKLVPISNIIRHFRNQVLVYITRPWNKLRTD